jgi:hypothetical protein
MIVSAVRCCARVGCDEPVKKPTNKYCSRRCCAIDPERNQRLRDSQRRRLLPLAKQLDLRIWDSEESALEMFCRGHEEAPAGLSRLAG